MDTQRFDAPYANLNPNYRGRVRSGCLTCRSKKVKCDEHRPSCQRCVRLHRECIYKQRDVPLDRGRRTPGRRGSRRSSSIEERGDSSCDQLASSSNLSFVLDSADSSSCPREYSQTSPLSPCDSDVLLSGMHELSQAQEVSWTNPVISHMISRDIHLCTTIDWLAASESLQLLSFSYFLEEVDLHLLTPFDPFNWPRVKSYAVDLAKQHTSVAAAISAVQLLFKAQSHSLPAINAMAQYELAKKMFTATLQDRDGDFEIVIVNVFILVVFSSVLVEGTDCIMRQSDGPFVDSLTLWSLSGQRTPILSRIIAWLKIIDAAARRGGNKGIMSEEVSGLLSKHGRDTPSLWPPNPDDHSPATADEFSSEAVFRFHLDLQAISLRIANLSHYHRSRRTSKDQEDVSMLMARAEAELYLLWQSRPSIMKRESGDIHAQFPPSSTSVLTRQIAVSKAAYYTELVEIGRNHSEQQTATPEGHEAMRRIRDLVDGERDALGEEKLSAGFLRPLFLYGIECTQVEGAQWAVQRMREIRDPICRSDFFSSYTQSLAQAQRLKKRRVTTRWFCYQKYGVRPPIL